MHKLLIHALKRFYKTLLINISKFCLFSSQLYTLDCFTIFTAIKSGFRPCEYWIYLGIYTKMVSSFLFFVSTVPGLCCASGCLSSSGGQWLTYKRHRNKPFTKDNVPLPHVITADNCSCQCFLLVIRHSTTKNPFAYT